MTIGAKIYTAEGRLQISHDHMIPQFVGKSVSQQSGPDIAEGGEGGILTRSFVAPGLNSQGRDTMVYWYIPQGYWGYSQSTYMPAAASGQAMGLYVFVQPGTVITDVPVAYVFALDSVVRSPEQYAMRLWKDGRLLFDSGTLHLSVEQIFTNVNYQIGVDSSESLALPARPGFLLPMAYRDREVYAGELNSPDGTSHFQEWMGVVQRSGNTMYNRMLLVYDNQQYMSSWMTRESQTEDQTYGNTTNLVMPVINTALYD